MAQQTINNGESGLNVRNSLNEMFTELYGAITAPIKVLGATSSFNVAINANTFISLISMYPLITGATVRVGTALGGNDLLDDTVINQFQQIQPNQLYVASGFLYFTISGIGEINFRIDVVNNFS